MRLLSTLILAIGCAVSFSSCGLLAHQARNAKSLLTSPFRAELEIRHLEAAPELEREGRSPFFA